ncbi:MAG: hypothetical protein LAT67_10765 [Balneolales bacterium]|nr:hypothetical protein [Balneolales bacterium]
MNTKQLEKFFEERPAINKTVFAKECGISRQYLLLLLKGERPFTESVTEKLREQIRKYGYEI